MKLTSTLTKGMLGSLLLAVASLSSASTIINAKQSLVSNGGVLTSQFYASEFEASAASSQTALKSSLVTTRNVLTSNYLVASLPSANAGQLPTPEFEDAKDSLVTPQNILSSQYRAEIVSRDAE